MDELISRDLPITARRTPVGRAARAPGVVPRRLTTYGRTGWWDDPPPGWVAFVSDRGS